MVVGFVVAVGIGVRLGCGGGVWVCRLWVALRVVLGDFGGWVKTLDRFWLCLR